MIQILDFPSKKFRVVRIVAIQVDIIKVTVPVADQSGHSWQYDGR